MTVFSRAVRAVKHRVDTPAHCGQHAVHFGVHGIERSHIKQPASQPRLVAGYHHMPAGMVDARYRFQGAGQRYPFVSGLDVLVAVLIDGAVAVKDAKFHGAKKNLSGQLGQIRDAVHGAVQ